MFWRKKNVIPTPDSFVSRGKILGEQLLLAARIDFDGGTKLQQALIGTFLFGMLCAEGMLHQSSPTEIRNVAISVFEETLRYAPSAAIEGVENCIQATRPDGHDTMKAIIHRGIDGHRQITEDNQMGLAQNIGDVLRQFAPPN